MGGLSLFRPFIKKSKEVIDLTTNTKAFNFLMSLIDSKGLVDVDLEDYTFTTVNFDKGTRGQVVFPNTIAGFESFYASSPHGEVDYEKYITRYSQETVLRSDWDYDVYNYAIAASTASDAQGYVFNGETSATLTDIAYVEETNCTLREFSYNESDYNAIGLLLYNNKKDELHVITTYYHSAIWASKFYFIIKAPEGYEFEL